MKFPIGLRRVPAGALAAFAALALVVADACAQTQFLYKYVDTDGKTTYSNTPPPKGVKFEKVPVDTAKTGVTLVPPGSGQKSASEEFDDAYRARKARENEQEQLIASLQAAYDNAVAELDAAKEPREGERSQNTNGTSRLNENYFNRVADLQKAVDDAKAKLDAARRQ